MIVVIRVLRMTIVCLEMKVSPSRAISASFQLTNARLNSNVQLCTQNNGPFVSARQTEAIRYERWERAWNMTRTLRWNCRCLHVVRSMFDLSRDKVRILFYSHLVDTVQGYNPPTKSQVRVDFDRVHFALLCVGRGGFYARRSIGCSELWKSEMWRTEVERARAEWRWRMDPYHPDIEHGIVKLWMANPDGHYAFHWSTKLMRGGTSCSFFGW